jgi:hypothetical protein
MRERGVGPADGALLLLAEDQKDTYLNKGDSTARG